MGNSRLVVALLNCYFLSSSMSFRNSRIGSSILRSCSGRHLTTAIINKSLRSSKSFSKFLSVDRLQMSTKTEADDVAVTNETTAEDLFGFDLPTNDNNPNLLKVRHTTAHIMAMAVQKLHPEAQVTIGPWIDQG